ncbi:MAG: DUF4330 family protein [Clostridia bacterium]|nr:DUF4330 family protein [Clostridia bacterium]
MAKNINKDGVAATNKKAHFNIIDAAIIILIISIVLGIVFRSHIIERLWAESKTDDYVVSFSVDNIRYTTPSYLEVGDEVYFADSGDLFGTLMSESDNVNALNITPASEFFTDANGNVVEVFYPDEESRVDTKGRIECRGYYGEDGGFSIDGRHYVAPGQSVNVKTELVTLTIRITDIVPLAK